MRPRVLIVIAQLDVGGAERQVVELATGLGGFGFEAEVAVFYAHGTLESRLVESGVPVHYLKRTTKLGHEAIFDLWRRLRRGRYDIVHPFLWPANWRARVAGIAARTPVVLSSPRSVETWIRAYHVLIDRALALGTDAIVVNAAAIRDYLVSREGLSPTKFRVIQNGIDLERFADLPEPAEARETLGLSIERPMVLIVGNHQPEKNHEDFIRTASRVRRRIPGALFALVGDGSRRRVLEALSGQLGLDGSMHWAGSQPDVRPWIAACDVAMNTSIREGCCNAILEAMAAGKPVVAYRVGGNPELVEDGVTGSLRDFGDVDGLAEAVIRFLEDPEAAQGAGARGRARAEERHSIEAMVRATAELYGDLLTARGR